ncbi:dystrophin-like [Venturia canescens]|uniref:dystrophin-like n=1 Tax=Venturia canescens TaxID=32260 RepID=UPI001C9BE313|nr:dystrophin-like [Venturia canescens]XP_043273732.1 dystrophin-like [Venturia canescens]
MTQECTNEWMSQSGPDTQGSYYTNQTMKQSQCENPAMKNIMRAIEECNPIRYASYRTAAKMQILHRELYMKYVQLKLIVGVFERHRLSFTENSVTLDETEIEDVISDIYFAAHKEAEVDFDVNHATKLAVHYILNTFDSERKGKVLVFSVKVALTLMSCGKLQDKYEYFYQLLADHNACLSKAALHTLLMNICKVTEMLGESVAYGSHIVQSSIDSCFIESRGSLGVSEVEFATWIMQDPPLLTWISTFNRMKSAEHTIHNIKCSSCKTTPVHGPRFSCLRCARYHQCQACFFLGKTSSKHKLKHPVREYCAKTSSREVTKLIIELIRNKLRLCPTQTVAMHLDEPPPNAIHDEAQALDTMSLRSTVRRKVLNDPQKELQSIINHLEEENRQLQLELMEICGSRAERLQRHRSSIESQLQRLKILKKYLFTNTTCQMANRVQSTPMVNPLASRFQGVPMLEFELSPIVRQSCDESQEDNISRKNDSTIREKYESQNENLSQSEATYASPVGTRISDNSRIDLSTWIGGGNRTSLSHGESGFSQWLNSNGGTNAKSKYAPKSVENVDASHVVSISPNGILRDNTPSSLQRPDKHSQHSSLQNIQGDLNDILNRLQHMVANDCLLEESFSADDNCELKRAATEMEDLLTGLIEGMESRKDKLATAV